eukprot:11651717-Alexandrium_andersonii.AAC.1
MTAPVQTPTWHLSSLLPWATLSTASGSVAAPRPSRCSGVGAGTALLAHALRVHRHQDALLAH